jgi:hypothetical protein
MNVKSGLFLIIRKAKRKSARNAASENDEPVDVSVMVAKLGAVTLRRE